MQSTIQKERTSDRIELNLKDKKFTFFETVWKEIFKQSAKVIPCSQQHIIPLVITKLDGYIRHTDFPLNRLSQIRYLSISYSFKCNVVPGWGMSHHTAKALNHIKYSLKFNGVQWRLTKFINRRSFKLYDGKYKFLHVQLNIHRIHALRLTFNINYAISLKSVCEKSPMKVYRCVFKDIWISRCHEGFAHFLGHINHRTLRYKEFWTTIVIIGMSWYIFVWNDRDVREWA